MMSRGDAARRQAPDSPNRSHILNQQPAQQPMDNRRSRTPGPEHMRAPPERSTDDR